MDEFTNSDVKVNPTMLATEKFNQIVQQVQTSGLNFYLQISPFSAVISIKRSLIKDKSGKVIFSPKPVSPPAFPHASNENIEALIDENLQLKKDLTDISKKYEEAVNDCTNVNKLIKELEKHQKEATFKIEEVTGANEELLLAEVSNLKNALVDRDDEILHLQNVAKSAKEATKKLNTTLRENRNKFKNEKVELCKEHRAEIRTLKKELGDANSNIVKLEKKVKELVDKHEELAIQTLESHPHNPSIYLNLASDYGDDIFEEEDCGSDDKNCPPAPAPLTDYFGDPSLLDLCKDTLKIKTVVTADYIKSISKINLLPKPDERT